jgi:hypothetical protein
VKFVKNEYMRYYLNKKQQANGDHEVHAFHCQFLPQPENRIDLGEHLTCSSAVTKAKTYYQKSNGCFYCSKDCHTS